VVSQSGSSFVCTAAQTGQQPPSDAWNLLAASGAPGEQGPQGAQGQQGPQGPQGSQGSQGPQGAAGQSPTLSWGAGADADRIEINGTASGPHLTGPQGPQGPSGPIALSGAVTRDETTGLISSVALTGGPTYSFARTDGLISSFSNGTHTWTLSRDNNGRLSGWNVS
jgi:YD repeat-containing protein